MQKPKTERHKHQKYPRLQVWLRPHDKHWLAYTFLDGQPHYHSTETGDLSAAFRIAESWYKRELRASEALERQHPIEKLAGDPTIGELYASYLQALKPRKKAYAEQKWSPIRDFWRTITLRELSVRTFHDFIAKRRKGSVCDHTLHKDITLIRQILKYAMNHGRLDHLPHIPKLDTIEKNPRPWFTKQELETLFIASVCRIQDAPNVRVREERQDLHDLMRFLVSSMIRVGEVRKLRYTSCTLEHNDTTGNDYLTLEVSGKRGLRHVVTSRDAACVYKQRLERHKAAGGNEGDLIFPHHSRDAFRELLIDAELRTLEEKGKVFTRNLKSLRATAISHFILDHPNVNLEIVAKNAGTSPDMIFNFYAKRLTPLMSKDVLSQLADGEMRDTDRAELEERLRQLKKEMAQVEAELQQVGD